MLAGITTTQVPYRGLGPAVNDLIAGHVDLMFDTPTTSLPLHRAGKVKIIGTGTPERVREFPEVPTIAESLPGYRAVTWYAMVAPPQMPAALADRINRDVIEILGRKDVAERVRGIQMEPGDALARRGGGFLPRGDGALGQGDQAGEHFAAIAAPEANDHETFARLVVAALGLLGSAAGGCRPRRRTFRPGASPWSCLRPPARPPMRWRAWSPTSSSRNGNRRSSSRTMRAGSTPAPSRSRARRPTATPCWSARRCRLTVANLLYRDINYQPGQFVPVSLLAKGTNVLSVRKDLPGK